MRRRAAIISILAAGALLPASIPATAGAATQPVVISLDRLVTGEPKSVHKLYAMPLEKGYYDVTVVATSGTSVHADTTIIVKAGSSEVRINDVERQSFKTQTAPMTLDAPGSDVVVSIQLGRDKVYSGGREVRLQKVAAARAAAATSPAPPAARPAELPRTGLETSALAAAGASAIGYGIHAFGLRRRSRRGPDTQR